MFEIIFFRQIMASSQNIKDRQQVPVNIIQEVVESSEVPVHTMQGMHVLGEAVDQQEFLADQVIFQEFTGLFDKSSYSNHLIFVTIVRF